MKLLTMEIESRPQFDCPPALWSKSKLMARDMRREPTDSENILWQRIRNRQISNFKFRRQHGIERFIVDFVCLERHLVLEVDGSIHEDDNQRDYDTLRQEFLESQGFQVL